VTTINAAGESSPSHVAAATATFLLPSASTNPQAVAGDRLVNLSGQQTTRRLVLDLPA
jgi:hypothetical protein